MFDDRRKYLRFDIPLKVEYEVEGGSKNYTTGVTANFSREGINLVTQQFDYDPSNTVELKLQHPTKESYIVLSGDVVWKRQVDDKWYAGLRLRQMDKGDKSDILGYAYDRWLENARNKNK